MTSMLISEADTESFAGVRPRLFGIARRVLGNPSDADDVVQDAWIRWQGTDRSAVRDPVGFLVTTTSRLALTAGQSARVRHEISIGSVLLDAADCGADPLCAAEQGQELERALLALLEKLSPTERAVYILREAFEYPHRRIAQLLGLSEANVRQIVTRARRHLSGDVRWAADATAHARLRDAFLAAAGSGELTALEQLLVDDIEPARLSLAA
jgi:RNA polymerase sigma-70 factor (ECF subfamily)